MHRILLILLILCAATPAASQELQRVTTDPTNDKFFNAIGTAALAGRTVSFLVTHQRGDSRFSQAYLMFPGSPGYGNLGVENGAWRYTQKGNLVVRARRHFIEPGTLTVVIDAPSDQQGSFPHAFRASPRYGEDVRGVIESVERSFGALDWTFVGTSEGTVSATHAARMLGDVARRLVLTSSMVSSAEGRTLREADVAAVRVPVLWVHHANDPCHHTKYAAAKAIAEKLGQPLITVYGAEGTSGPPCEPRSEHGFVGREAAVIRAIRAWVKTGAVASRVDTP